MYSANNLVRIHP